MEFLKGLVTLGKYLVYAPAVVRAVSQAFGPDPRLAVQTIRKIEQDTRAARDQRMAERRERQRADTLPE